MKRSVPKKRRPLIIILIIVFLILAALTVDSNVRLVTTEYEIYSDKLPESFDGLRVVQLSDLHGDKYGRDNSKLYEASEKIEKAIADSSEFEGNIMGLSRYYRESVLEAMNNARIIIDELEVNTSREYWPYPTYADLLFSVN